MKTLLAVAIAACALSGPSRAEEITLIEAKGTRVTVVAGSIRFGAEGHYASADAVLTRVSDGARHPISMMPVCRRDDGKAGGIGLVSYHDDKMSDDVPDFIARALCGRVGLRAWTAAQP